MRDVRERPNPLYSNLLPFFPSVIVGSQEFLIFPKKSACPKQRTLDNECLPLAEQFVGEVRQNGGDISINS